MSFAQTTRNVPGTYATIQAAITAADPGDIILVAAGTYNESVSVTKNGLILRGAQYGVHANTGTRTNPVLESVINSASPVAIMADNVVVDGFTIQGSDNTDKIAGIWDNPGWSGTHGGFQILNNIIQNNVSGIGVGNDGTIQALIKFNLIKNNNNVGPGSGNGFSAAFAMNNAIIEDNTFDNNQLYLNGFESSGSTGVQTITVSNNEIKNISSSGLFLMGISGATVTGNNIHNNTSGISVAGSGDNITISGNTINNNAEKGIIVSDDYSVGANTNISVHSNNIENNTLEGLKVNSGAYTGTLDATNNWWGSVNGPANAANTYNVGSQGNAVVGSVLFVPWLNAAPPGGISFAPVTTTSPVGSFSSIQAGIISSNPGGTIYVSAGTYNEGDVLIPINKSLTLLGPNYLISPNGGARVAEAIIEGLNTGTANALFGVNLGTVTFIVKGFTFHTLRAEMRNDAKGATVTLEKNIFTGNRDDGMWFDDTHLTVFDNLFTGYHTTASETIAMAVTSLPRLGTISITHNTWSDITGNGALNLADVSGSVSNNQFNGVEYYGMLIAVNTNLTISDNVFNNITNPVVVPTGNELTFGAGVRFYEPSPLTIASITGNTFSNSYLGVSVRATNGNITGAAISVNNNSFISNTAGILNAAVGTLNATNNWWGSATGPFNATTNPTGTGNSVSANVDYTPWLGQINNAPHPWNIYTNDNISDAIAAASNGDVVYVLIPGHYNSFTVNKGIHLIGGPGVYIDHGSPAITVAADNVTITGFTFSYGAADYAIQINANFTNINIHYNNFNTPNGVQNLGTGSVDATNNYWGFGGNINGPTIASNPGGTGSSISIAPGGTVTYNPWIGQLTTTSPTNAYVGTPINTFAISWTWLNFFGPNFVFQLDHNGVAGSDINTTVATNSYTVSAPLLYNTTYHWYVRSIADPLNVWIGPFSFTTTSSIPTLVSPANNSHGLALTGNTLVWNTVTGATHYRVTVSPAVAGSPFTVAAPTLSQALPALTAGTYYTWYVESSNNGGITWSTPSATWNFTTEFLQSPANLSVGVSIIPLFDWLDVTGAASYTLEISTDNTFSTVDFTYAGLVVSNYQVLLAGALTNGATYYWRVTSNNSVVSGTWAFIVVQPSMPYLTNPANGSTIIGSSIYFTWYVLGSSASNFVLEVDDANDFLTPIQTFSGLTTSYYSWAYSGLTPGSTYYWRVTAKTSGGVIVNYSNVWNFVAPGMPDVYPSYPTGGVTVYTNSPTLYWYTGTFYNGQFQIRYGITSGALGAPVATSNMYYTLSGLTAGSTYYWQVRSYNGAQFGNWSPEQNFVVYSTTVTTPVVPYLSWPIGGATVYTNPPSFYWYLGTYATGLEFYFEYDDDSGFGSPNGNSGWISTLNYTLPTSLASGTWYWHVKSRLASNHASESAYSSTESFVIQSSSSSIPTPTPYSPVGGATVYALNPTLTYYAYSTSALQYQINYSAWPSTDVNGVLDLVNTTSVWTSSTSYILTGLTPGVTYYWQVRARLAATPATISPWSSVATFTTAAGASAVVPLVGSPNYNQSIDQNTAVLSWIIPTQSSSPLTYTVQYSNKPDMSDAVTVNNVSKPEYQLNGLILNKTYYWRVSSKNTNGSSSYSSIGVFKSGGVTDVSKEQLVLPTAFELSQNYPNPFNPTTKITYALPQNSYVSIKVYDMLGREVRSLVNNEMLAGNHSVDWNGENNSGFKVASGTYVYRITAGSFVAVKKMILIK